MKKLALAFATAAVALSFAVPASAEEVKLGVSVGGHHRVFHRAPVRHVVMVRHDRGWHRGWEHNRHVKKIVIRHRG
jgi:hypothetical protein